MAYTYTIRPSIRSTLRVGTFWAGIAIGVLLFILGLFDDALSDVLDVATTQASLQAVLFLAAVLYVTTIVEEVVDKQESLRGEQEALRGQQEALEGQQGLLTEEIATTRNAHVRAVRHVEAGRSGVSRHKTFDRAASVWLDEVTLDRTVEELLICAFTAISFRKAVRQIEDGSVQNARVLLFIDQGQISHKGRKIDPVEAANDWEDLHVLDPHMERIEIRRVEANLQVYFAVADRSQALLGWLYPQGSPLNLHTKEAWTTTSDHRLTRDAIDALVEWFELYWEGATRLATFPADSADGATPTEGASGDGITPPTADPQTLGDAPRLPAPSTPGTAASTSSDPSPPPPRL